MCSLCYWHVVEVCQCLLFCGVLWGSMYVAIVQLIVSALTKVLSAATVQGQEGHHLVEISGTNYARLAQKQNENSSKPSDDGHVSESSSTLEYEQRPS